MKTITFLVALAVFISLNLSGQESIYPVPSWDGSKNIDLCSGGSFTVSIDNSTSGHNYNLTQADTKALLQTIIGTGGTITFNPVAPASGVTSFSVFDATDFSPFINFTATVVADPVAPVLDMNPSSPVCEGTSVSATLNTGGSGGVSCSDRYEYSTDGGNTWADYNLGTSIATTGLTSVKVMAIRDQGAGVDRGCYAENEYTWVVNPLPVPGLSGNTNPCFGDTETYTTEAGMTGYTWVVTNGTTAGSSTNTINVIWDQATGAGSVSITYTDGNGCTSVSPTLLPVTITAPPVVSSVSLQYALSLAGPWTAVSGDLTGGYSMCIHPDWDFFYLDVDQLVSTPDITAEYLNPFYVNQTSLPTGWTAYWTAKGVVSGAPGWQGVMYEITIGNQPIFYVYKTSGGDYQLIDGLMYQIGQGLSPLRISGDYPDGNYTYDGSLRSGVGCDAPLSVGMAFQSGVLNVTQSLVYCTIQDAIDGAAPGDLIKLGADFTEGKVTVGKSITLDGGGFTLTSTSTDYGIAVTSPGVTIQDITVTGAGTFGIHQDISCGNLAITDATVDNCGGTGFAMNCSDGIVLTNITSTNNGGNGLSIQDCHNVTINGITTSGNTFGTFGAGIGIFSTGTYCTAGCSNIVINEPVSIAEVPAIYQEAPAGAITGLVLPSAYTHYVGLLAPYNTRYYFTSLVDALAAAELLLSTAPVMQLLTYVKEVGGMNLYVRSCTPPTVNMSIQAAVDASDPGDVTHVYAGIYVEQLVIQKEGLSITGAGAASTFVQSPATLTWSFMTGTNYNYPVIGVDGVSTFTLSELTVDGAGQGNSNFRFTGIGLWNSGATITNVDVTGVRETPLDGSQHGIGVYSYNNGTGSPYLITINGMNVDDFQKNAFALLGNDLTVDMDNVTITGSGPLGSGLPAQNGIQIGYGAGGTVDNCVITDIDYTGGTYAASGYILTTAGSVAANNVDISNCQTSVYIIDSDGSFNGSDITNPTGDGVYIYSTGSKSGGKILKDLPMASVIEENFAGGNPESTNVTFSLDGCVITGTGAASSMGVVPFGYDAITAQIDDCEITNWEYGVVALDYSGAVINSTTYHCDLSNNILGFYSNTINIQDAEENWWGSDTGPYNNPYNTCGLGSEAYGTVDFIPWCVDAVCSGTTTGLALVVHNVTKDTYYCKIQDAIDDANDGDVITALAGTYNESLLINKGLTLTGAGALTTAITGGVVFGDGTFTGVTIDGFTITGDSPAGSNDAVFDMIVGGVVTNITIQNCVLDGEGTNRECFYGRTGRVAGTWTWHNNTIRDFREWYVIDNTGSTNYPVVPLTSVVFTDNIVTGLGGTIVFRGKLDEPMTHAVISGNTMTGWVDNSSGGGWIWAGIEINNVTDLDVFNNTITGVPMQGDEGQAFQAWSVTAWDVDIHNNVFDNNYQGIYIPTYVGTDVNMACYVPTGAIYSNSISGNTDFNLELSDSPPGSGISSGIGGPLDATCNWWGSADPFVIAGGIWGDVQFMPFWTSNIGPCNGNGPVVNMTQNKHYLQIQPAINEANAGDEIHVAAGTYVENLLVSKAITLIGAGRDVTFVDAASANYTLDIDGNVAGMTGTVTIQGFSFRDPSRIHWMIVKSDHIPNTAQLIFQNNRIGDGDGYGWWDYHSHGALTCTNNIFSDVSYAFQLEGWDDQPVTIQGNEFTNLHVWLENGVPLPDYPPVALNPFTYNGLDCNNAYLIDGNTFHNYTESGYGIVINGGYPNQTPAKYTNVTISGNVFDNVGLVALRLTNRTPSGEDPLGGVHNASVTGNTFNGCTKGLFVSGLNPGTEAHTNQFLTWTDYALENTGSAMVNATCNWWNTADPYGVANSISGLVQFLPYLTSPTGTCNGLGPVVNVTQNKSYMEIQPAINEANPMDRIDVAAGVFHERLTVSKSLDLRGAQYGVDPTLPGSRINPANETVIDLVGLPVTNPNVMIEIPAGVTDVSFDGFTLNGSQTTHYADEAVVRSWDDDITINNNIIDGYYNLLYKGGSGLIANYNRMVTNKVGITIQPYPAASVTLSGNTIVPGLALASDPYGIYLTGGNNVVISGNSISGFAGGCSIGGSNNNNIDILGNTLSGNKKGVNIWGNSTFIEISGNEIYNSIERGIDIKGADLTITGNNIYSNGTEGVRIAYHVIPTVNVAVNENILTGNGTYGLLVDPAVTQTVNATCNWWGSADPAVVAASFSGNANVVPFWVGTSGPCTGSGLVANLTQGTSYMTIAEAINAAIPNDVLQLSEHIFNERVVIDKPLTLQGVSEANCIIDGSSFGTDGRGIYIDYNVENVTIKYLTVRNFQGSNGNLHGGIYAIGGNNNLTVEHVTIHDNVGGSGFYANGPIDNVLLDYVTSFGHTVGARGIVIWNGYKSHITITNCHVYGNNCCGIELQDGTASGVTMNNNNVHDNGDSGMSAVGLTAGAGPNTISNNILADNGRYGIEVKCPDGTGLATGDGSIVLDNNVVTFTASTLMNNRDHAGIAVFRRGYLTGSGYNDIPTGVIVTNNTVSGYTQMNPTATTSEGFGIVVEGVDHTVTGNILDGNDVGLQLQGGGHPVPNYNFEAAGDGEQADGASPFYFGRGNAPYMCNITAGGNSFGTTTPNGTDTRVVVEPLTPLVDPLAIANQVEKKVQNTDTQITYCSFQGAINAVYTDNGDVIVASPATYYESNILVNKQLTIQGTSRPDVILGPAAVDDHNNSGGFSGVYQHGFIVESDYVTIMNLTIDGEANTTLVPNDHNFRMGITTQDGMGFDNLHIDNVSIDNIYRRGVYIGGSTTSGHLVENCSVTDVVRHDGIISIGSAEFLNNTVSDVNGDGATASAAAIRGYSAALFVGNNISNCLWGIVADTDAEILDNVIDDISVGIVMNNLFYGVHASDAVIQGNTITNVRETGYVMYGVGMSLVNLASGSTIGGSDPTERNVIDITSGTDVLGMNVWWNPGPIVIQNNEIRIAGDNYGIYLQYTVDETTSVLLQDNEIYSTVAGQGTGVLMNEGVDNGDVFASFTGNEFTGLEAGLYMALSGGNKRIEATIGGSAGDENTFTGNTTAIRVEEYDGATNGITTKAEVLGNVFSGNTGTAIEIAGGMVIQVYRNQMSNNGYGLKVQGTGEMTSCTENFIDFSTSDGVMIAADAGVVGPINDNHFEGNLGYGINNLLASPTLDATCNYYDPSGNAVAGNTTYLPYLITGVDNDPLTPGFQPVPGSCTSPGEFFVNDDSLLGDVYTTAVGNNANLGTSDAPFRDIQYAIGIAPAGSTIKADVGAYVEDIVVDKELTLLGPNAGICGNGARVGEAIVYPATADIEYGIIMEVTASNVTIDGFLLDGDNPALVSGFVCTNGADQDASDGIAVYSDNVSNLTAQNNIIRNLSFAGVSLYGASFSAPATSGHLVSCNLIEHLGTYDPASNVDYWGIGVLIYNDQYARIVNNEMVNVRGGVQTGNFSDPNPGDPLYQVIDNNTIQTRRRGIFHNLHYGGASALTLSNNTITAIPEPNETVWDGIFLGSLSNAVSPCVDNHIDGSAVSVPSEGYEVWNVKNTAPVGISGGSVAGVTTGLFMNNYEGNNSNAGDGAHATLSGLAITPAAGGTGIRILDSPSSTHANVQLTLGAGVTVTGGAEGVTVEGQNATLLGTGDLALNGQTSNYFRLFDNAVDIDATGVVFDGSLGSAMTLPELFTTEDMIVHAIDDAGLGFILVNDLNTYVTLNSFVPPATTEPSIQRAIDEASAGWTVNVNDGTYNGNLNLGKELGLVSANGYTATTIAGAGGAAVTVASDGVELNGFTVTNPDGSNAVYSSGFGNLEIRNNNFESIGNNLTSGNTHAVAVSSNSNAVDNVLIEDNIFTDIHGGESDPPISNGSAAAIGIGWSDANYDITNLVIQRNVISNVNACILPWASQNKGGKGAYGIIVNTGGKATATGQAVHPLIVNNEISDLEGLWAHGIGLEGDIPAAQVENTLITDLTDHKVENDASAIMIEDNESASSSIINNNSFTLVESAIRNVTVNQVDVTCNWFGTTDPAAIALLLEGPVNVLSFLDNGTDNEPGTVGFQPVPGSCGGLLPVHNVTQNLFYGTIKSAVLDANSGDVIDVAAGTIVENGQIVIDKNLTIGGAGMGATIVRTDQNTGSGGDARGWWLVNTGITFHLSDMTLDGTGYLVYQGIRHMGTGTIDQVEFTHIKYNESGPTYGGVAVAAFGSGIADVDITNCDFSEIGRVGVLYFGTGITGSDFIGNTYAGKGPGNWLDYALDISAGAVVNVQNNIISGNRGVAASDGSTSGAVMVTTLYGAGTTSTILNNEITDNSTAILVGYDGTDVSTVTAHMNRIFGNDWGVYSTTQTVDATDNWWGDPTGPYNDPHNTCGLGDTISGNVTFFEWWADAAMTTRYAYPAPVITSCPADVTLAQYEDRDPYATGWALADPLSNCYNPVVVTYDDDRSGLTGCNVTGTILRTFTATDYLGQVTTCTQTITITDVSDPVVVCPADITQDNDPGVCGAVVTFEPTASDFGFFQGFEHADWVPGHYYSVALGFGPSTDWNEYNSPMNRVPSGTGGIVSKTGSAHAVFYSAGIPPAPDDYTGIFSRLGGYGNVFGDGFVVTQDVYFDLSDPWVATSTYGWDASCAANTQTGGHLRDFIFHTAGEPGKILVAASNNTNFTRRNDLATLNHFEVVTTGWYTLQWVFRDAGDGTLAVDCNLLDALGNLLWTETRNNTGDVIATVVGGNRYLWFTFLEADQLAIDDTRLMRNLVVTSTPPSGSYFIVGTTPVSAEATDACGNGPASCTFNVTVEDNEPPVAVCQNITVYLNSIGEVDIVATDVDGGSTDNCGIASYDVDKDHFTCADLGANTVILTVTDVHS
ncbi:MAG: right-handed parallel beta-helix repeat-containing protein, partial [Bacteroidales bacterium]|nr:right-handed parallel beta-helix repeat-containing protein [Bacteroidales bacterium]